MRSNYKLLNVVAQWPVAIVVLGIALTIIWVSALIWLPLRLFGVW